MTEDQGQPHSNGPSRHGRHHRDAPGGSPARNRTWIILALVVVQWALFARTARATALSEVGKEYIEAARTLRLGTARVLFRHLLPNCLPPLTVIATVQVANAISLEATLSFLGAGIPAPQPSWGVMVSDGRALIGTGWWISPRTRTHSVTRGCS